MSGRFDEIRAEIVENDVAIVAAVNHRLELVTELWALKAQLGLDTVDADREGRLRAALHEANARAAFDRWPRPADHRTARADQGGGRRGPAAPLVLRVWLLVGLCCELVR